MRRVLTRLCSTALAASMALGSGIIGANAIPLDAPSAPQAETGIMQVQMRHERNDRMMGPEFSRDRIYRGGRGDGRWDRWERDRGRDWGRDRNWRDRRDDVRYYRGYRGYRYARPGYRQYDGWWFPGAAFVAGAIVGGAIASEPPIRYKPRGDAHTSWCYDRYRSYRASDNTFQPYHGPRKPCISPYG